MYNQDTAVAHKVQVDHAGVPMQALSCPSSPTPRPFAGVGEDGLSRELPSSNTGAIVTSIDYLAGTTTLDPDVVLDYLHTLTGVDVEVLDRGMHGYTKAYQVGFVRVAYHPDRPDMRVFVESRGEGCQWLGLERLAQLFYGLNLRVTRIDPCVDHCPFTPAQLLAEWQKGNVNTQVRYPQEAKPGRENIRTHQWHSSAKGDTLYLGSNQASQMMRCYDMRGFTRVELQCRKERAHKNAELLFQAVDGGPEAFSRVVLGLIRGFVDFRDLSVDSNPTRAPLLPFWAEFVEGCEKVKATLEGKAAQTFERLRAWLEFGVSAMLATYARCGGSVGDLLKLGKSRMRSRHRSLVSLHLASTA